MRKKVLLTGIIVFCFFIFTTTSVNAANEERKLTDKTGDVFDFDGNEFPEISDIDMYLITYTQNNEQVTIEIEFVDTIEDSEDFLISIALSTNEEEYNIYYYLEVYGETLETGEEIDVDINGFGSNKLIFQFNLIDDDEDFQSIVITTFRVTEENSYTDMFPNLDELPDVNIQGPTEGEVGESIQFYGSASNGTPPYTFKWDFDDDEKTDSTEQNPTYTYKEPGEYNIILTILDSDGNPSANISFITINVTSQSEKNDESGAITFIILIAVVIIAGVAVVVYIIRR
jgi:PKD repeat protein